METQDPDSRGVRPGAIAAGAMLLAVGTAMFLDTTGAVDIRFGRLIGPFVLIALGSSMVLERSAFVCGYRGSRDDAGTRRRGRRRGGPITGIWLIGVGAWMLLAQNDLFGLTFHNSWPLLVVLGGIIMVIRGLK
jgi:hypothetical protein